MFLSTLQGLQGQQGIKGEQGIPGPEGEKVINEINQCTQYLVCCSKRE